MRGGSLRNAAALTTDEVKFAPSSPHAAPRGPKARTSQSPRVSMMNRAVKLTRKSTSARSTANRAREKGNAIADTRRFSARTETINRWPAYWCPYSRTTRRPPHKNSHKTEQRHRGSNNSGYLEHQSMQGLGPSAAYSCAIFGPTRFWIPSITGLPTETTPKQAAQTPADPTPWKVAKSQG